VNDSRISLDLYLAADDARLIKGTNASMAELHAARPGPDISAHLVQLTLLALVPLAVDFG
jgi:hypothetical protein